MPPESSGRTCGQFGTRPFGSRQFANRQFGIVAPAGETGPNRFRKRGSRRRFIAPSGTPGTGAFFLQKNDISFVFSTKMVYDND